MWGEGVWLEDFSIKIVVDGCGYLEVWIDYILIFSLEMWFCTYIGSDSRNVANGYTLCTYISHLIY